MSAGWIGLIAGCVMVAAFVVVLAGCRVAAHDDRARAEARDCDQLERVRERRREAA